MNHFHIEHHVMHYPLGVHIDANYKAINYILDSFLTFATNDIAEYKNIGIVCRGSSGAIMASFLYTKIKLLLSDSHIKICHIKKNGENSHNSAVNSFGIYSEAMYIWIDDFVDSGTTFEECLKAMKSELKDDNFQFNWTVCASGGLSVFRDATKNCVVYNF